jgi:hypothetical protein
MTGEAATAPDQHGQRNLSSTSEALLSSPDALPGVFPELQAHGWRRYSKTGPWPGDIPGFLTDAEQVSAFNFGRLTEMRRGEIVDINAAVKGLFSKITESLSPDLRGVSTEAVEEVRTALTAAAVAAVLDSYGFSGSARRIIDLAELVAEDPDESEIDLDSLKRAVVTVLEHPQWGEPSITLRAGLVSMEWQTRGGGTVSISFLPGDRVSYSALSAPATTPDFLNIGGRHLQEEGIGNLRWFTDRIVPR